MTKRMKPSLDQRVAKRFLQQHGASSAAGWTGDRSEMLALQIILQSCEVETGTRVAIDLHAAEFEADRLMMIAKRVHK